MSGKPNDKIFKSMVEKHGSESAARAWYREIGAEGGKASGTGGFYNNPELARKAGKLGGAKSRRGPWSEEQKKAAARLRANKSFQEGFNEKITWRQRIMRVK